VIFVNWTYPDACGIARLAPHFNVPFVTSVSGSDAHVFLTMRDRATQIREMFHQAAAVTTRSQDLKDMLIAHGVDGRKVNVVYNGVDGDRFQPIPRADARQRLGLSPDRQILLYVGRLSPEKGPDDLVRALAHARRYYGITPQLIVVGDGPLRGLLAQLAQSLAVSDQIVWAGWKKPFETRDYFCAADCLCLPSQNEGVANVVLESFSCGLPVVATAVGGIPEIMTEETGLLAAPMEPASLAAAIHKACRRTWSAEAIRRHGARFDWNANAEFVESILRRAVERHGRPASDVAFENVEDLD
jgi:glycosyltransferase involved in cell wall biosynthesis